MPRYSDDLYVPAGPVYDAPQLVQARQQRAGPSRLKLFAILFGLVAALGLAFTFLRPPVYVSTAIVLVREAAPVGSPASVAAPRVNVARHAQAFGNPALLAEVYAVAAGWRRAGAADEPPARLSARALPEAGAVELRAEGRKATLLPTLLNAWISGYQQSAQDARKSNAAREDAELRGQVQHLDEQIAAKTEQLERFRKEHGIVSDVRDENSKLSVLQGLHRSLDNATAELATAQAQLDAIKDALAAGRSYVRPEDKVQLAALENQVAGLRAQMKHYDDNYTPAYMARDSGYADLHNNLEAAEKRLAEAPAELQRNALRESEQRVASARVLVSTLKGQLAQSEKEAQGVDAHLGDYQSLTRELEQLQGLKRGAEKRLVDTDLLKQGLPVDLRVLQEPFIPDSPERPLYARDAGISLGAALVVALLGVLIYEFLVYARRPAPTPYPWPVIVSAPGQQLPQATPVSGRLAEQPPTAALPGRAAPRELSQGEVGALFAAGTEQTRELVPLLLSGIGVDELGGLRWVDVDLAAGRLQLRGASPRVLGLHPALGTLWAGRGLSEVDGPVLAFLGETAQPRETVERLLSQTAEDAGLAYAHEIGADTLRHTYLCYLVRQGLRLSDLKGVAGTLEPPELDFYRRLSPPGAKAAPEQVRLVYPLPAVG